MSRPRKSRHELNYSQKKVKKPRPVYYDGPDKNVDPDMGRDILVLYIHGQLGYSPIRCILGLSNDHAIEDVVRQHMLGRKDVDGAQGELYCPSQKVISEECIPLIKRLAKKYGTEDNEEVQRMLHLGEWRDVPAYEKRVTECPKCGKARADMSWAYCPFCRTDYSGVVNQRKLFDNK